MSSLVGARQELGQKDSSMRIVPSCIVRVWCERGREGVNVTREKRTKPLGEFERDPILLDKHPLPPVVLSTASSACRGLRSH